VVVGASGDDGAARLAARALLMSGLEVVFVGGDQSVEQLMRTVVAEDAGRLVVDGSDEDLDAVRSALDREGLADVETARCDLPDAPQEAANG
jgi:methylmalonyl-CoA mutase cobalamin-binding subunit